MNKILALSLLYGFQVYPCPGLMHHGTLPKCSPRCQTPSPVVIPQEYPIPYEYYSSITTARLWKLNPCFFSFLFWQLQFLYLFLSIWTLYPPRGKRGTVLTCLYSCFTTLIAYIQDNEQQKQKSNKQRYSKINRDLNFMQRQKRKEKNPMWCHSNLSAPKDEQPKRKQIFKYI